MGKDESYIEYVEDRLGIEDTLLTAPKIKTSLPTPSVTFEEGIKLTIDWYLNNQEWIEIFKNKKANSQNHENACNRIKTECWDRFMPLLKEQGHSVIATDIHDLDIADVDKVNEIISSTKPDLIIQLLLH
ncbi:MAG: hypothetical protein MZV70_76310 [Desulfobacterales bacterium]|nr:hypothetical protein [Desulfobacterales bacterium]